MLEWSYAAVLVFSIAGLVLFDWRWKLAFFHDTRRTTLTIFSAMAVFIVWDLLGIWLGVFYSGDSPYASSFMLLPEFPVEELFFLFLLCYITLLLYRGVLSGYRHLSRFKR